MTENLTTLKMLTVSTLLPTAENASIEHTNATLSTFLQSTHSATEITTSTTTEQTTSNMDIEPDNSGHFIVIPFAVLLLILALSGLVFLIGRNRRRLARIYCPRRSERKYSFEDDSDSPMEQGDGYDFDDPSECLLKSKLQIDNALKLRFQKVSRPLATFFTREDNTKLKGDCPGERFDGKDMTAHNAKNFILEYLV